MKTMSKLSGILKLPENIEAGKDTYDAQLLTSFGEIPLKLSEHLITKFTNGDSVLVKGYLAVDFIKAHLFTYVHVRSITPYLEDDEVNEMHVYGTLTKKVELVTCEQPENDYAVAIIYAANNKEANSGIIHVYLKGELARTATEIEVRSPVEVVGRLSKKRALSVIASTITERRSEV